jgi:hypothetical protein
MLPLEEPLRRRGFASIELRDSPVGRQAYLIGTRLAVDTRLAGWARVEPEQGVVLDV